MSGGKDSLVTLVLSYEAIKQIEKELDITIDFDVLHCYTGTGAFETFDYILQTANDRGWRLNVEYPNQDADYPQNVLLDVLMEWGFAGRKWHKVWLKALKYNGIRNHYRKHKDTWFISGKAPTNSQKRKLEMQKKIKAGRPVESLYAGIDDNLPFISPMFFMTKADTWQIVKDRNLKLVDSYVWLSHSLECLCPAFATPEEFAELQRWRPDLATDISILNDQYGGWHYVKDARGRSYKKNFGKWGMPPKTKNLKEDQEQLQFLEELVCVECSAMRQSHD